MMQANYSDGVKSVLKKHLKMLDLISLLLTDVNTIQIVDAGHYLAELRYVTSSNEEVSVEDEGIVSIYIISHLAF